MHGTRRDAERVLAELLRQQEVHGPTPTTAGRITFDGWLRQHLAAHALSPRTRADSLRFWTTYSTPQLRSIPIRGVTTAMPDAFVAELRARVSERTGRPLSPRTVALVFNVIRSALSAAVRQRVLPANPALGVVVKGARR